MDYYPEGDLFGMIVDKQRYSQDPFLIKSVFIQLVDAITYCHSKGVYHCDLKPENIMVANNGAKLILADFGLALREPFIESNVCCGSSYYMSPERIQNFCQGFDSKDSRTIHIDRLLRPNELGMRENVCFPTAAGDVWSLAIILINLISTRNPWLKASLNDTTFRAFVKDPSVLLKILPISREIFHILCRYLTLNPWERGSLFKFREDVLECQKLSESGPLSINSRVDSMEMVTTESQAQKSLLPELAVCKVPIDHVAMDRKRSMENSGMEDAEQERNYVIGLRIDQEPDSTNVATAARAQGIYGPDNPGNGVECGSCVACGYGVTKTNVMDNVEPYESIESLNRQNIIAQELNNEEQQQQQTSIMMKHSKKNPNMLRKIFGRRHTHHQSRSGQANEKTLEQQRLERRQGQQKQLDHQRLQQQLKFQQLEQQRLQQICQQQQQQQQQQQRLRNQVPQAYRGFQPQMPLSAREIQMRQLQQRQMRQQMQMQQRQSPQPQPQPQQQQQPWQQNFVEPSFLAPSVQQRRITEENLRDHNMTWFPIGASESHYAKLRVSTLLSDEKQSAIVGSNTGRQVGGNCQYSSNNNYNISTENCVNTGVNTSTSTENGMNANHTSGEGSTTDTMAENESTQTSSASSIEASEQCNKAEVLIHRPGERPDHLAEDLSMVSVMSVQNSSTYMNMDF